MKPILSAILSLPLILTCAPLALARPSFDLLVTFDYPNGATQTEAGGINDLQQVAGTFVDSTGRHGFVRYPNHFGPPIQDPNDLHNTTNLVGINNLGMLCGWYTGRDATYHSFVASEKIFTEIDIDSPNTEAWGLNDAGDICGTTNLLTTAFVVINGVTTTFVIPGADTTL